MVDTDLVVSGVGSGAGTRNSVVHHRSPPYHLKNHDIGEGASSPANDYAQVDPALLETNSPSNRRVIEDAYRTYTTNTSHVKNV